MTKKGGIAMVITLMIVAICTSGLMRAAIELLIFLFLVGYTINVKKKR